MLTLNSLRKRIRQQQQSDTVQGSGSASVAYGSVVEVDGVRGVLAPLELEPAAAAVSVLTLERVADNLFLATVADGSVLRVDAAILETMPQGSATAMTTRSYETTS